MRDNAGRSEASMREQHHLKSEALPYVGRCLEARTLKRLLSMPRLAIFDSRVCGGTPSFAAAPPSPETRPRQAINAASITFFWRWANSFSASARLRGRGRTGPDTSLG